MPSTVIRRFDYDATEHRLDVEFVTGRRYSYYAVPDRIVQALRSATSKGSFFNRYIRDHFPSTRQR